MADTGKTVVNTLRSNRIGLIVGLTLGILAGVILLVIIAVYWIGPGRLGRIVLRNGVPGEYDDLEQLLRDEAQLIDTLDESAQHSYYRAKAFQELHPPNSISTDISLSQFLTIQEKGVSAWEFEPDLQVTNCFVECRTEVLFYDSECSVQTNLPIPKQNDVIYWEAKIFEKPDTTLIAIGLASKPYPLFRLPGMNRHSYAYYSDATRRESQPFYAKSYAVEFFQGDVIGVGYRPRNGSIFFTRNGKRFEDIIHNARMNLFPTIGANGPCTVHVNFGQSGFVFIEANVKKWGLAPMAGSLAPPPAYGTEQDSLLLESGQHSNNEPTRESEEHSSRSNYHQFRENESRFSDQRENSGEISLSSIRRKDVSPPPYSTSTSTS